MAGTRPIHPTGRIRRLQRASTSSSIRSSKPVLALIGSLHATPERVHGPRSTRSPQGEPCRSAPRTPSAVVCECVLNRIVPDAPATPSCTPPGAAEAPYRRRDRPCRHDRTVWRRCTRSPGVSRDRTPPSCRESPSSSQPSAQPRFCALSPSNIRPRKTRPPRVERGTTASHSPRVTVLPRGCGRRPSPPRWTFPRPDRRHRQRCLAVAVIGSARGGLDCGRGTLPRVQTPT